MVSRWERWERFAPLAGVAAVILWVVGILVLEGMGDTPDEAGAQEALAYFEEDENSIYLGSIFFWLGTLVFFWFAASLRAAVAAMEVGVARLAPIVFGAAVAFAVCTFGLVAPQLGGAFGANDNEGQLTAEAAQALWLAGDGFFIAGAYSGALLLIASAIAILRWRILPVWLAWVGLLLALVMLIPPIGWAGLIFVFPLWVAVVSVLLYLRATRVEAPRVEPTPTPTV